MHDGWFLCECFCHFKLTKSLMHQPLTFTSACVDPQFSRTVKCLWSVKPSLSLLLRCRSMPTTSWRRRLVTEGTWPSREAWPCRSSPPPSSQLSAWVRTSTTRPSSVMHRESLEAKTNRGQVVYQCPDTLLLIIYVTGEKSGNEKYNFEENFCFNRVNNIENQRHYNSE